MKIEKFSVKFDLEKYLNHHNLNWKHVDSSNQDNLEVCPFCKNVNSKGHLHPYRFYVNCHTKIFYCHNCGAKGGIIKLLAALENSSVLTTFNKYIDKIDQLPVKLESLPEEKQNQLVKEIEIKEIELPQNFYPMATYRASFKDAYKYLDDRGVKSLFPLAFYDIRYCPEMKRIIFPIYLDDKVVGWQGRDITGIQEPKYFINKGFKKVLFNYDIIKNKEEIAIVEGIFDSLKTPNSVCLFGKELSDFQLKLLLKCPNLKTIVISIDPEEKGCQLKLAKQLYSFFEVKITSLPLGRDPGSYSVEEMQEFVNKAKYFDLYNL